MLAAISDQSLARARSILTSSLEAFAGCSTPAGASHNLEWRLHPKLDWQNSPLFPSSASEILSAVSKQCQGEAVEFLSERFGERFAASANASHQSFLLSECHQCAQPGPASRAVTRFAAVPVSDLLEQEILPGANLQRLAVEFRSGRLV